MTDRWRGKWLPDRPVVNDADLHYRIYNAATGALLAFGSNGGPESLNGVAREVLRTQAEYPGIRLYVQQHTGPAY